MQIQTIVGPQTQATTGSTIPNLRGGPSGEAIMQELHGRYYETAVRKSMFSGATTTGVTTSAGFATTYTGFCLTNPIGSSVNLALNKIVYAVVVAQTSALILGLMTGYHAATPVTQTTPLVPLNNFVGSPTGVGLIASAVTLPIAPTRVILLDTLLTGAITTQVTSNGKAVDEEGGIIVPPGGFVAFYTSGASVASSLAFGMQWEEVSTVI